MLEVLKSLLVLAEIVLHSHIAANWDRQELEWLATDIPK